MFADAAAIESESNLGNFSRTARLIVAGAAETVSDRCCRLQ